ncbi:DUF58 domain-containing protein [Roseiconus nitratireducens]|nr:DUF58 domain-containing protein [Roseiconus nitratireducens]
MIAGAAALLLLGWLFGASLWVLAAIAAALVIVINRFLASTWTNCSIASRAGGDAELKVGEILPVDVSITNQSRVPVFWLLVEDLLPRWATVHDPPTLEVDGDRVAVLLLWPGQTHHLKYQIKCRRRGYFQIGPTVLETGDLMGLYRRYRVGAQPQYVTVLPKVVELTDYEIGSRRPMGEIRMRDNVMEDPTRLRGIRRWEPGDPMRRVHWSATARTGVLHSKVYEPSSIAGATLVVDLHCDTNPVRNEPIRTDLAITTAVSIANSLHEQSQPFALISNGRDAADRIRQEGWSGDHRVRDHARQSAQMLEASDRIRPVVVDLGRGAVHLQQLRRTLARLERTDAMSLGQLLTETESRISSETTLIAIFQMASEETLSALIGFSRRGRAVAAIINTFDINDYGALAGPLIAANIPTFHLAAEGGIAELCRSVHLRTA